MLGATYAKIALVMASMIVGTNANGVCYSPFHHDTVTSDVVASDFELIAKSFSSVRTYYSTWGDVNAIELAANAGLKIAVGIYMDGDETNTQAQVDALCNSLSTYSGTVEAVYVGNENLTPNGAMGASDILAYVEKVKACDGIGSIPVGSVQRITEWVNGQSETSTLAAGCDILGTNIYPYFTQGDTSAVDKLKAQAQQMDDIYSGQTYAVTETGWPSEGDSAYGNTASVDGMQQYLTDLQSWTSETGINSYYFMMFDLTAAQAAGQPSYEEHFGLYTVDSTCKVDSLPSASPSSDYSSPSTTDAPSSDYSTPTTTDAPSSDYSTPTTTDAPSSDYSTPASTESPSTDAPSTDAPVTATPTAAATTEVTTATPTAAATTEVTTAPSSDYVGDEASTPSVTTAPECSS